MGGLVEIGMTDDDDDDDAADDGNDAGDSGAEVVRFSSFVYLLGVVITQC